MLQVARKVAPCVRALRSATIFLFRCNDNKVVNCNDNKVVNCSYVVTAIMWIIAIIMW